uniref:Innexin n=1 Tax=Acrobeloides nanus TaxID=290746 RepID=A0A914DTU3_9BILA
MYNLGINFNNVVIASQSVLKGNDGVTEVDEEILYERVRVIDDNFKCASSSNAFAAFIAFEAMQGSPLTPFFGSPNDTPIMPLIPRITYCDYHFVTLVNDHVLTYRCYLDANWHERIALFTWIMLVFLAFINFCNLFFWVGWAIQMKNCQKRQKWVMKKWMNGDNYSSNEQEFVEKFAGQLKMKNLLLFYYIEAHTDRVVTRTFADALYQNWMEKQQVLD